MEIQYIDIHNLEPDERAVVEKITADGCKKLDRILKNPSKLVLRIRTMNRTGKRKEYEIAARAESPSVTFSTHDTDWDLRKCVHKVMDGLEKEIVHRYKKDTTQKKSYYR